MNMTSSRASRKSQKRNRPYKKILVLFVLALAAFAGLFFWLVTIHAIEIKGTPAYYSTSSGEVRVQSIDNTTYAFNAKTGKKLSGLISTDKGELYANSQTGALEYGLHEINQNYYYFTSSGFDNVYEAYQQLADSLNSGNAVIEKTISKGLTYVGKSPYDYGGGRDEADIKAGKFDCSSFVNYMYHLGGHDIWMQPYVSTTSLATTGTLTSWNSKERGDLLITSPNASVDEQHVAIYLGDGFILHDSAATNGVAVSRLNQIIDPKVLGNMTWAQLFEPGSVNREV